MKTMKNLTMLFAAVTIALGASAQSSTTSKTATKTEAAKTTTAKTETKSDAKVVKTDSKAKPAAATPAAKADATRK